MTDSTPPAPDLAGRRELILRGEIDLNTAPDIERDGNCALTQPDVTTLAIDLNSVTFIDSTGIGALIRLRLTADKQAKNIVLVHPSSPVQHVLQVTALEGVFTIEHSEPSA